MSISRIQEWFDKMVRGMAKQSWQLAMEEENGACLYRTTNGMCCAVGHIIPDDAGCIPNNETVKSLSSEGHLSRLGLGTISGQEFIFLIRAQHAHDSMQNLQEAFINLGKDWDLTWPTDIPVP